MVWKKYRQELLVGSVMMAMVVITILYGRELEGRGIAVRRWSWENFLWVLPVVPLLFLQRQASLPGLSTINEKRGGWLWTMGAGLLFGILDVIIIKMLLHPEPYDSLPPFLQPFPYSIALYFSGALEIELYYRMIPLTILLLLDNWLFRLKHRKWILAVLAVITSLIEPMQQFPDGAAWFVAYATISGVAMNLWQFISYTRYGFLGSLAVRWGHYLVWHIALGIYVKFEELM